jgi:hypothetical protein
MRYFKIPTDVPWLLGFEELEYWVSVWSVDFYFIEKCKSYIVFGVAKLGDLFVSAGFLSMLERKR